LVNIYKQIQSEYPDFTYDNGDLTHWADQGVLLLNSLLTVEDGRPLSHSQIGRQALTDAAIKALSNHKEHVVFMLWGKFAQSKASLIDQSKHLVLQAAHPSPFSAYNGFFGCNHFTQCNEYLRSHGLEQIQR
jgi:uracil-DNA glycosylase